MLCEQRSLILPNVFMAIYDKIVYSVQNPNNITKCQGDGKLLLVTMGVHYYINETSIYQSYWKNMKNFINHYTGVSCNVLVFKNVLNCTIQSVIFPMVTMLLNQGPRSNFEIGGDTSSDSILGGAQDIFSYIELFIILKILGCTCPSSPPYSAVPVNHVICL